MATVLVLGSGGREHSLAWKFAQSPQVAKVLVAPGNSCEFSVRKEDLPNPSSLEDVCEYCRQQKVDLVVIGPEKEICEGWAERIRSATLAKVFAPSVGASQLEASKSFAKEFLQRHSLPTAEFATFNRLAEALDFVQRVQWPNGIVVKEDGLCAGKGVYCVPSAASASQILHQIFGVNPEAVVVVEELLVGYEISALCFSDGRAIRPLPFSQDHKRVDEGDRGPNTGGMGAVAPIVVSQKLEAEIHGILQKTIDGIAKEGASYCGVLYAGLMITASGPKVLEFNCRFGDPETQTLLPLLKTDLYEICLRCCDGTLDELGVEFEPKVTATVVLTSGGYPGGFEKGRTVSGIPQDERDLVIFHAGLQKRESGEYVNSGGRVLCATAVADSFRDAVRRSLGAVRRIQLADGHFRRDIGHFVLRRGMGAEVKYSDGGVDIAEGNALVEGIKADVKSTLTVGTEQIGGFGAVVDLKAMGFVEPQLVIGMDGVGTKIELATAADRLEALGDDLVGMCVNDVLCHGAKPVAFLDYYVTGRLDRRQAARVVKSIAAACRASGCALVGGETAEMPGVYEPHQWDLAGCCVGARDAHSPRLPLMEEIAEGDALIGLSSNGLHSNGFSLVRKILRNHRIQLTDPLPWEPSQTFADELLRPTRLYPAVLLPHLSIPDSPIKALAHITGGGIRENLPRVLPSALRAEIDCRSFRIPAIFHWLQLRGPIGAAEMFKTFNCGIGMVAVVRGEAVDGIVAQLNKTVPSWIIGRVGKKDLNGESIRLENLDGVFEHFDESLLERRRVRVGVLISGTGSNMRRLIAQSQMNGSECEIRCVISNRADVAGLEYARESGVEAIVLPHKGLSREEFEHRLTEELEIRGVEMVCLAGFMRILTPFFVKRWYNRLINLHPSLLPAFKGAKAVQLALEAGVKVTGCTAHFVVEEVDCGQIIAQETVTVDSDDNEDTLHSKIQVREHQMYPQVMEKVAHMIINEQI